jgi:hypothetical protein
MICTLCYECFKRFKDGRQSTRDELYLGWPSASCDDTHVAQVRADSESLVLSQSSETSKRKCQQKKASVLEKEPWFLHHNNVPTHSLLLICDFLANTSTTVLPGPFYSPKSGSSRLRHDPEKGAPELFP